MAIFAKWTCCKRLGLLSVCFGLVSCQSTDTISNHQKHEFIKLLYTLPTNGDTFTDEGFKKAGPYLPVIFSLTEKDLATYDIYLFAAIIGGVCCREEHQEYAVRHFSDIRHPELKLFLGSLLFEKGLASSEIMQFLRDVLQDEQRAKALSEMVGPNFQDFKKRLMAEK